MEKKQQLQKFLSKKISDIDESLASQSQDISRLKLATMRASYAKVIIEFIPIDNVKFSKRPNLAIQKLLLTGFDLFEKW